ncbi:MAG: tRNA lysidine(34) synthetase TilS [Cystobacterineae bacterium]|nr:tRNA lysidine(34) synthetase TilS [Cystobacterineae bacterium]
MLSFEKALCNAYIKLNLSKERLLLAVSGGADSLALLLATWRISSKLALHMEVASVDHGLREESAEEVAFVQALSKRLGVAFHTQRLNICGQVALEEEARRLRYAALEEIRQRQRLHFVVTAHTASDQACTLLMKLSRGAALRGARAIWRRWGYVVRPMLSMRRAEAEHYVRQSALSPVMDAMNEEQRFFRVRMRRVVLKALENVAGKSATLHLAQFCQYADEDEAFLQHQALQALQNIHVSPATLDAMAFLCLEKPLQRRILAAFLGENGLEINANSIENSMRAIQTKKNATLAKDRLLKVEKGLIFIAAAPPRKKRCKKG